jgi:V/A-type H+-transporting ATPase subunit E
MMDSKIQELADKLYQEGVERGNAEAQKIVDKAHSDADSIIEQAQAKAAAIVADAEKKAEDLNKNTRSELKMYFERALEALKSDVANVLSNETVSEAAKGFVGDKDYLNKFIVTLAERWSTEEPITISAEETEGLKKYFAQHAKALLDKGVTINQVNGSDAVFSVSPADGAYKVNFGEEEFKKFFETIVRPELLDMLY